MLIDESFFKSLNRNFYSPSVEKNRKSSLIELIEIKEVTKLVEKIKWIDRFLRSYTGHKKKLIVMVYSSRKYLLQLIKGKN